MSYKFIIGVKNLEKPFDFLSQYGFKHVCLLLNGDLFEYGTNSSDFLEKTYERHKDVGRNEIFNWTELGHTLNGETNISPDQLEQVIKDNGEWAKGHYNILFHNCLNFIQFCLDKIGYHEASTKIKLTFF